MVNWATYNKPAGGYTDQDVVKGLNLYNYEDPATAFDSFLRDSGISPSSANPFTQTMRRAAAPLGTAYASEWARQGQPGTNQWYNENPQTLGTEQPYNYGTYLGSAMGGQNMTQGRGVYGTLQRSVTELPTLIKAIREENNNTSNTDLTRVNPFLGTMAERLADDNGMGTVNYLAQLNSPMMATGLRQAYRNQLVQRQQNALRAQMNSADPMSPSNDIWHYLLGM